MSTATAPPMKKRDPKKQLAAAFKEERKAKAKANKDKHEGGFLAEWEKLAAVHGLPMPVRDFKFAPSRKWQLDFAWPWAKSRTTGRDLLIAIEIQGGTKNIGKSRHSSPAGMKNDADKHNAAVAKGWRVLFFTDQHSYAEMAATVRDLMLQG